MICLDARRVKKALDIEVNKTKPNIHAAGRDARRATLDLAPAANPVTRSPPLSAADT